MLCIRHFPNRTFHSNNKFCSRTLSNWRNSPIIFSNQFMQIQQECNTPILFKPQQFNYERYQFCNGNVANSIHLPSTGNQMDLDSKLLWLDPYKKKNVKIEICKGSRGHKYFRIVLCSVGKYFNYPNISVPEDAYAFIRAFDQIIGEFAAENFEQKLQIQDPKSTVEIGNNGQEKTREFNLKTVEVTGIIHKFQFELLFFPNEHQIYDQKQICLRLSALNKSNMRKRTMTLPLQALPWLREQMAEMLIRHDGTEAIASVAPTQIPKQFFKGIWPFFKIICCVDQFKISFHLQRHQFCSENNGNYNLLPGTLDTQFLWLGTNKRNYVKLQFQKGKSGHNSIKIISNNLGNFFHFPNILVPQDGYAFVRGLDELIEELATENFEQKLQIQDAFPAPSAEQKLHQKEKITQNIIKNSSFVQQYPKIQNYNNKSGVKKQTMPVHFETQQKDVFHASIVQNSNSYYHNLNHSGMQPQFANKKPTSFQQYSKMATKIQNSNQNGIKNQRMFRPLSVQQKSVKQSEVKKSASNEHLDPQMAELEEGLLALFDFDDEEMDKYRRLTTKIKNPSRY